AMMALFTIDFNPERAETAVSDALRIWKEEENLYTDRTGNAGGEDTAGIAGDQYACELVEGTLQNRAQIDEMIGRASLEWQINRMAGVDRNIIRIAVYEMFFANSLLPPGIAINEAVELAKFYSGAESGRFVNGVLGAMVKNNGSLSGN
ncbi:MAG: transcription antitermination factor NusB, partial [Negativicutes bacterium]|nr:transcription antitermination factor NusB [Negativicutes bacterium]